MFERFTDSARTVVVGAYGHARMLNHNFVGTEHLLLGLLTFEGTVAARALAACGIKSIDVVAQIEEIIGRGALYPHGDLPFTPRAKSVFDLSLREALQIGHNFIGPMHILLAIVREGEGVAAQILEKLGTNAVRVRERVIAELVATENSMHGEHTPSPEEAIVALRRVERALAGMLDDVQTAIRVAQSTREK